MKNTNSFNSENTIEINHKKFKYFDLNKAAEYFRIDISKTPISIKICIYIFIQYQKRNYIYIYIHIHIYIYIYIYIMLVTLHSIC